MGLGLVKPDYEDRAPQNDPVIRAAQWIARLNADDRSEADERGLHDWLAESPAHRDAFMEALQSWEAVGGVARLTRKPSPIMSRRRILAGAAAVAVMAAIGGIHAWRLDPAQHYDTGVGELRTIVLEDGSTVTLDTDSAVRVRFTSAARQLHLDRGRAHFEVAHDPARPFVVNAFDRTVTALGTIFDVGGDASGMAVLLLEGRVLITPDQRQDQAAAETFLSPGERLTLGRNRAARLDRPDATAATAWREGRLAFDRHPLHDAVAEMNRYSRTRKIRVDTTLAGQRISGSYTTRDPVRFVESVAALLGGTVEIQGNDILLSARPADP